MKPVASLFHRLFLLSGDMQYLLTGKKVPLVFLTAERNQ